MLITDYTTYAEVRAVLNLSAKELPDAELGLGIYANSLELDLDGVTLPDEAPGPGPLKTAFLALPVVAERTTAQQKLYNLTRLYSTYAVAKIAARTLSMSIKTISDSKATLTRFSSEASYKLIAAYILESLEGYKDAIENINTTTVVVPDFLIGVSPSVDRVTNE